MSLKKTTELDIAKNLVKEDILLRFDTECIRKKSNMSNPLAEYRFDHDSFIPTHLEKDLPTFSPKLDRLLQKIDELDTEDERIHGKNSSILFFPT
jgi:hypothetical protein